MNYDFDQIVNRRDTQSLKYDFAAERGMPEDVLPLWVADMDFKTPSCVIEALVNRSRHGIFGYSESKSDYFDALKAWYLNRFSWDINPAWLVKTPGVVYAISTAVRALTQADDGVLIQEPVYYPFSESIRINGRKLVVNELRYNLGKYSIDFEDFEQQIIHHNVKLFILCSPHNPVGRVWKQDELTRMGDICLKHNVTVIADEIHADFTYPGHQHMVFAGLKPAYSAMTITCTAPTKTFNLAGLQISNILIENTILREKFKLEIAKSGYCQLNIMGITACQAAYSGGSDWLEQLQVYLQENLAELRSFILEKVPTIRLVEPEGTYLVWLDTRKTGKTDKQLENLIVHKGRLWLDAGTMFGKSGSGFWRINIACPRSILRQALNQLDQALNH